MATANVLSIKNQGIVAYDGSAAFNGRTLTAASSKLTITNGDGVSANPTVDAVEANFTLNNIGGTLGVSKGGTGMTTITSNSLVIGHGTSAMTALGGATNGQIPIGSTGNAPVLATITAGSGITVTNGAGSIQIDGTGGSASAPGTLDMVDDFLCESNSTAKPAGQLNWVISTTGTGSGLNINSVSGHPGILSLTCGSGTSLALLGSFAGSGGNAFLLSDGAVTLQYYIKIPTLSVAGTRFSVWVGLAGDSSFNNAIFFYYRDDINSGKWQLRTYASGVSTQNNSNTTVDTNWHVLKLVINAAGTSVSFYVDGTEVSNSPITTNIPSSAVSPALYVSNITGTGSCYIDLFTLNKVLTTPR